MTLMERLMLRAGIAYAPEGEGAGAAAGGAGDGGKSGAGDGGAGGAGDGAGDGAGAGKSGDGDDKGGKSAADIAAEAEAARVAEAAKAPEPAKFVPDPNKTPDENKAAETAFNKKITDDAKLAEDRKTLIGAPDKYADIVVPEGMHLDQEAANQLFGLAKTLDLSQAGVDQLVELQKAMYAKEAAANTTAMTELLADWDKTNKADPITGGKDYEKHTGEANAFLSAFGSTELVEYLTNSKLIENPMMRRMLVQAGQAMGEGKALGGGISGGQQDAADLIYGKK